MDGPVLLAVGGLALAALIVLRKPLAFLWRLLFRSGIGLCCLWLFNQAGALIGIQVGGEPSQRLGGRSFRCAGLWSAAADPVGFAVTENLQAQEGNRAFQRQFPCVMITLRRLCEFTR